MGSDDGKKKKEKIVSIKVRDEKAQKLGQTKLTIDEKAGVGQIRAQTKEKGWVLSSVQIPLSRLELLNSKPSSDEVLERLNNPHPLKNKYLKKYLQKLTDTYGEIERIRGKYNYKTHRYKRKKKQPEPKKSVRG
ncbi:MAG: hypothetical protein ACTSRW_14520 [Candidatus Helarchaeota archaeon]